MMRVLVLLLAAGSLCGCALGPQVRSEFRDHPVRTFVLIGGGVVLVSLAARGDSGQQGGGLVRLPAPPNCSAGACQ